MPGGPLDVTDPSPSAEVTPSPDGLPRRRKRTAGSQAAGEAAAADALEAATAAEAPEVESEPEIEESLRQRGLRLSALDVARKIVEAAEDKKAADIVLLDVTELTSEGVRPIGREGGSNSHWTLLDFGFVIVHIFAPPERDYYQLERHWIKAKTVLRVQ
jgi:ribosome-associated protein